MHGVSLHLVTICGAAEAGASCFGRSLMLWQAGNTLAILESSPSMRIRGDQGDHDFDQENPGRRLLRHIPMPQQINDREVW
jgi:hypothetical protein